MPNIGKSRQLQILESQHKQQAEPRSKTGKNLKKHQQPYLSHQTIETAKIQRRDINKCIPQHHSEPLRIQCTSSHVDQPSDKNTDSSK